MQRYREIRKLGNGVRQKSNQVLNLFTDKPQKMSDWVDEVSYAIHILEFEIHINLHLLKTG